MDQSNGGRNPLLDSARKDAQELRQVTLQSMNRSTRNQIQHQSLSSSSPSSQVHLQIPTPGLLPDGVRFSNLSQHITNQVHRLFCYTSGVRSPAYHRLAELTGLV